MAEAVERVRAIKFCATIVPVTRACGIFDSRNRGILADFRSTMRIWKPTPKRRGAVSGAASS